MAMMMNIDASAPDSTAVYRPRNRGIAMISVGIPGLISLLFSALSPALPNIAQEYAKGGDGTMVAQMVFSLSAVMMIVGAMLAGPAAEVVGRRRILIVGLIIYAAAGVAGMFAADLSWLAVTRALAGLVSGMMLTASYATIGEYYDGDARERMLGFASMFASICAIVLFVIGGMMVDALGWRAMFGLFGLALLLVPVAWVSLHREVSVRHTVHGGWATVLSLWPLYLLLCVYTILIYITAVQSPFLLNSRGITSATQIGLLLALTSIFGAAGGFLYGFMRRSMGFAAMLAFASFTGGGGMVLAGLVPGVPAYVVSAIAIGLGIGIIEPTVASEILKRSPERLHDRAMGLNLAAMFFGQFLNPLVMGPMRIAWGIGEAFAVTGTLFVIGGLFFLKSAIHPGPTRDQGAN